MEVAELVDDRSVEDAVLPADPGLEHVDAAVPQFLDQPVLDIAGELAPVLGGIAEFDGVVVDVQIGRLGGAPVEDDPVKAGALELRPPGA